MRRVFSQSLYCSWALQQYASVVKGHQVIYYKAERIYLRKARDIYTFISGL